MVQFALNQTIETTAPTVTVDAGLPLGRHRFQLVVADAAGNRSQPAVAVVDIRRELPTIPTPRVVAAPASPIDPGAPAPGQPAVSPVVSPTRTASPIASPRSTAPHAPSDSSGAPTSAGPPRKARGSAKKPQRSPPRKPRPPRKEK
jgi:hypothetical protein